MCNQNTEIYLIIASMSTELGIITECTGLYKHKCYVVNIWKMNYHEHHYQINFYFFIDLHDVYERTVLAVKLQNLNHIISLRSFEEHQSGKENPFQNVEFKTITRLPRIVYSINITPFNSRLYGFLNKYGKSSNSKDRFKLNHDFQN